MTDAAHDTSAVYLLPQDQGTKPVSKILMLWDLC
jgi:hypothetical protein